MPPDASTPGEVDASDLLGLLDDDPTLRLIDVREADEFADWSIPRALNIPLGELEERIGEVGDGTVVAVCAAGVRAATAASILAASGIDARILAGGMMSWGHVYDEVAEPIGAATVVQIRRRGKGCLSYVIGGSGACLVIDPSLDVERVLAITRARGWTVTHVADTHLHADHLSGASLLAEITGAQLVVNPADAFSYGGLEVESGTVIELGGTVKVEVHAEPTPGHTTGSTTFSLGDQALFTGDTLFIESVGRPDLAEQAREFAESLYASLHETVLAHSDDALVLPAHFGPSVPVVGNRIVGARLGDLKRDLKALRLGREEFVDWASSRATPRPPNYQFIVEANMAGQVIEADQREDLENGPNRCAVDGS